MIFIVQLQPITSHYLTAASLTAKRHFSSANSKTNKPWVSYNLSRLGELNKLGAEIKTATPSSVADAKEVFGHIVAYVAPPVHTSITIPMIISTHFSQHEHPYLNARPGARSCCRWWLRIFVV